MKVFKAIFPVLVTLVLFSCKPSGQKAAAYSDQVTREQGLIQEAENNLILTIRKDGEDTNKVKEALVRFDEQITRSIGVISAMEAFDSKDKFKKDALAFFEVYRSIAGNEYKQVVGFLGEYTKENAEKARELGNTAAKKREAAFLQFENAQKDFAREYQFRIKP